MRRLQTRRRARRAASVLLSALALLLLTGCAAGAASSDAALPESTAVPSAADSVPDSGPEQGTETSGELAAYRAVLQDGVEFLLVGETAEAGIFDAEPATVDRIPHLFSPYSDYTKFDCFAVLDLDGDGMQEVVLRSIDAAGDMGGYLVLHRQGDELYGFLFDWRSFWSLKTDGSFEYSSPTGLEWAVGQVQFGPGSCEYAVPLYSGATDYTYEKIDYTVNGRPAGEEEYNAAVEAQNAKPDAAWYELGEEGIRQAFGE